MNSDSEISSVDSLLNKLDLSDKIKSRISTVFASEGLNDLSLNTIIEFSDKELKDIGLTLLERKSYTKALGNIIWIQYFDSISLLANEHVTESLKYPKLAGICKEFFSLIIHVVYQFEHMDLQVNCTRDTDLYLSIFDQTSPDAFYLQALEVRCLLQQRLIDLKDSAYHFYNYKTDYAEQLWSKEACKHINILIREIDAYSERLIVACTRPPRLYLFFEALELNKKERLALLYIIFNNMPSSLFARNCRECVEKRTQGPLGGSMQALASIFAEFTPYENLSFFHMSDRIHLKQELFETDDFTTLLDAPLLKISPQTLYSLCGGELTPDDFYKIDKTALADILLLEDSSKLSDVMLTTHESSESDEDYHQSTKNGDVKAGMEDLAIVNSKPDSVKPDSSVSEHGDDASSFQAYTTDLEYLQDNLEYISALIKVQQASSEDNNLIHQKKSAEVVTREHQAKARAMRSKVERRLQVTLHSDKFKPKLETLSATHGLCGFEKEVLLILCGAVVSPKFQQTVNDLIGVKSYFMSRLSIGMIISILSNDVRKQIEARVHFYKSGKLVKNGFVRVIDNIFRKSNILDCEVLIDRQMLDYIVGLDTEIGELVDGSELITPKITLDKVSLPPDVKSSIIHSVQSHEKFKEIVGELELGNKSSISHFNKGLRMLFHGPPGTGKTMTAHGLANHLGKKLLTIGLSSFPEDISFSEFLKFLFRECKIHNAILFFDECELLFHSRDISRNDILSSLLTDIEDHTGIIILATNRPANLDEAFHRRIQLSVPFTIPDFKLRAQIWESHVPHNMVDVIDWEELASNCELTGGLIKNAVLSAIAVAIERQETPLKLTLQDLSKGAKKQLRNMLEMCDFEHRVIPDTGFNGLAFNAEVMAELSEFVKAAKSSRLLSTQWGFGTSKANSALCGSLTAILWGVSGSGKTSVAHALAYELSQPLKVANVCELLAHGKTNVNRNRSLAVFFEEAKLANAMILLEDADPILTMDCQNSSGITHLLEYDLFGLFYEIRQFSGPLVLTTKLNKDRINDFIQKSIRFVIGLPGPTYDLRRELWEKLIPSTTPVEGEIDFEKLAQEFNLNGGGINVAINQAAMRAAARQGDKIALTQEDLLNAANEICIKLSDTFNHTSLYQ
ncbi:hypothetical protein LOD99_6568 [Oopsacas minuta]|uniref:AAA+ ATPase domain-containing protein n=1 Tax=Oopsacas minuta TaxID=111878 RepID=A0AAV7JMV8_9METZ|nr:hypothetical protein LOD99_6568 [Oopsacas minuta]